MTAHQQKKLDLEALRSFRDRFDLPLKDNDLMAMRFYCPPADSPELQYLKECRQALGGFLPTRRSQCGSVAVPGMLSYGHFALAAEGKEMSTTMALVRLLVGLLKNKNFKHRIVPIVADEARTFGMADLFRQLGIYSPRGQLYEPEDADSLLSYRERRDGQLLEEGITEAGAMASWIAAATSYSVHDLALLPFYIYYSIFGFQRVGDLIWAAADQRARGFLIGATAGRTTLSGEGLQHQDGSSHVIAATIPNCRAYDPAFAYELAVILDHGARRILEQGIDEFYYLTVMNEKYPNPSMAKGVEASIIKGMYQLYTRKSGNQRVQLLGSGAILLEVIAAADLLAGDWGITSDVWSVTSYSELAREARDTERENLLHPRRQTKKSHLERCLEKLGPVVAASDYVRAYPQLIAPYLSGRMIILGTDGFGRSDTRDNLRRFFEVNRYYVTVAALKGLADEGQVPAKTVADAIRKYRIDPEKPNPVTV